MKKVYKKSRNMTYIKADKTVKYAGIRVREVGYSSETKDYAYSSNRNAYLLHFLFSGEGTVYDTYVTAPCGFLFTPFEQQSYISQITSEHPKWEHYWIMLEGDDVPWLLEQACFPNEASVFELKNPMDIKLIFERMMANGYKADMNGDFLMTSFLFELFHLNYNSHMMSQKKIDKKSEYVDKAIEFIEKNYMATITGNDIAGAAGISPKYLRKLFKIYLDTSPGDYLNQYRIARAKKLLQNTTKSVTEISEEVGYKDLSYFVRVFKKYSSGFTPVQFRKEF